MDSSENRNDLIPDQQNRQIQLVVNQAETDDVTIDLGNVLQNMKKKGRVYLWLVVLCLVAGLSIPLLMYQLNRPELTVSSVVTLKYEVPVKVQQRAANGQTEWIIPENPEYEAVSDLTAPDGTDLDVYQITSSYVLQTALDSVRLSKPITVSALRSNISIHTMLTEESSRTREALAGLADAKNADAYRQLQTAEMKYQNRFVVSLTNGFAEDEEARTRTDLEDGELKQLLNRILAVYNDLLVQTYVDVKLPEDAFSVIDIREQDIPDSVDQLRAAIDTLYQYCGGKPETVKSYRSWKTGRNLTDWMETIQTFKSISADYLYAKVSGEAITRDKASLLANWKFTLRTTQNELNEVNEKIAETEKILQSYKNDEVFVSQQESDAAKSTRAATEYYNKLVLSQTENYEKAAKLKATIADYTYRINQLENAKETEVSEDVETELSQALESAQTLYTEIRAHMEEVFSSPMYTTLEEHSAAQGKLKGFLAASAKNMIIGGVVGAVLACGLWFLAALAPEFVKNRKEENGRGEQKK